MGLVGKVSSMGRELPPVDGEDYVVARAHGPYLWDTQGRRSIDCVLGFGSVILGHSPATWCTALNDALQNGTMPGLSNLAEQTAAKALCTHIAPLDSVTFVNSGSEAVQLACRIARAVTARPRIVGMAGGYHGWHDGLRIGDAAREMASSDAAMMELDSHTSLVRFNDLDALETALKHNDVAAILIEPILANAGCLMPHPDYLAQVCELATAYGSLIIADEVLTGFRTQAGLACHAMGLKPDLATLGKAIGNGLPVAAVAGTREIMATLGVNLPTAGTANGNPLVCTGISSTLAALDIVDYKKQIENVMTLRRQLEEFGVTTSGAGLVFSVWFTPSAPHNFSAALKACSEHNIALHMNLRKRGVITMPTPLGRLFFSFAHDATIFNQLSQHLTAAVKDLKTHR